MAKRKPRLTRSQMSRLPRLLWMRYRPSEIAAEMEAVSKTLMHDSLQTTLRVYAVLGEADVRDRIMGLGLDS